MLKNAKELFKTLYKIETLLGLISIFHDFRPQLTSTDLETNFVGKLEFKGFIFKSVLHGYDEIEVLAHLTQNNPRDPRRNFPTLN